MARSPSQGLCLASSVPPSSTRIPSRHSPAAGKATPAAAPCVTVKQPKAQASPPWPRAPVSQEDALECCHSSRPRCPRQTATGVPRTGAKSNNTLPLLSTYFVPSTVASTLHVRLHEPHSSPFHKVGKGDPQGSPTATSHQTEELGGKSKYPTLPSFLKKCTD